MDLNGYEKRGYLFEDFRLFHLQDVAMERVDWHYHEFHKLILFLSGRGAYAIEGKRYDLFPGDVVLIGRGCIHRPEIEENLPYERVILYIAPEYLQRESTPSCDLSSCFALSREKLSYVLRPSTADAQLRRLVRELEAAMTQDAFGKELLRRALFLQLLVTLNRAVLDHRLSYVSQADCDEKIVRVLQYLNRHLTEPISADDLAREFYTSKYHLMRRFKQETGFTLHGYLTEKRLLLARQKLLDGMPVLDACYACGYQDYSAFSRAYKKQFGRTPREK